MQLVEVRDLEGPNIFGHEPLIKLEVALEPGDPESILDALQSRIRELHQSVGVELPTVGMRALDRSNHIAVYFPWTYETLAVGIANLAFSDVIGEATDQRVERLKLALERDIQDHNQPRWIRDRDRVLPIVSITATNGKTTTTRLLVHVLRTAGKRVGWTCSSGVFVENECVLEGDFTGPAGARRVFREPDLDVGVFETARGGILLRGLAYESNDVGIFMNVSSDHLALEGIERLETLSEVKSLVVRVTRPEGWAVLSADHEEVWRWRKSVRARVLMISLDPNSEPATAHLEKGGSGVVMEDGLIVFYHGEQRQPIVEIAEVPVTFDGRAEFMVENALAATAGALGLGVQVGDIRAGLESFKSDSAHNYGRLNFFDLDGRTILLDYAHNSDGVVKLARFARTFLGPNGSLHMVVGTAGDRRQEDFHEIGRQAALHADAVYVKNTPGYERGSAPSDMCRWMEEGVRAAGAHERFAGDFDSELRATVAAIERTRPGDVIAIMSQSEQLEIMNEIRKRGGEERR